MVVSDIINGHLPKNQPVLKVFVGSTEKDRKVVNYQGSLVYAADSDFLWTTELDNDEVMKHATNRHKKVSSPYVVASIDNGPYLASGLPQIKGLLEDRQDYTVETVVLKEKGIAHYGNTWAKKPRSASRGPQNDWLNSASKRAQDVFNWSPTKQDSIFIQSTHRFVEFEKSPDSNPEIKISSMVTWENLPSNEELLSRSRDWNTNVFLIRVRQGYFFIRADELEYLQKHADEKPQVHTLTYNTFSTKGNESFA